MDGLGVSGGETHARDNIFAVGEVGFAVLAGVYSGAA